MVMFAGLWLKMYCRDATIFVRQFRICLDFSCMNFMKDFGEGNSEFQIRMAVLPDKNNLI